MRSVVKMIQENSDDSSVYFGSKKAGSLFSTDNRGVVFQYSADYVASKDSVALSLSLPLRIEEFS